MRANAASIALLVASLGPAAAGQGEGRVVFVDEFDGTELAPRWERRDPDEDQFVVEGGEAIVICRERGVRADRTPFAYNALRLAEPLPADFELAVEFEYEPMDDQWVVVDFVQDERNRMCAWTQYDNKRNLLYFRKVVAGQENAVATPMKTFPHGARRIETIRIRRKGRAWTAVQRIGDQEWTLEQNVLRFTPLVVEISAYTDSARSRQDEVRFRRVELRDLGK